MRTRRAVGYCLNEKCEEMTKGVFLLNHERAFYCPNCRVSGFIEKETGYAEGNAEVFREVRVEFCFEPIEREYKGIAIVRDEGLQSVNSNVYYIRSPLIRTEKRAMTVAERTLASLTDGEPDDGSIPMTNETILNVNDPDFVDRLRLLESKWQKSPRSLMVRDDEAANNLGE